ncbi:MAG: anaerobic ribonucleoside-triphosphate reductase activating protein [Clostridia bacterium]|nr:anaerobic ribonucleoside-triphosphate reductase activating protein [Clostridia bacterium]
MKILGFQKLTMLDYPGKMACLIFTAGCNFRCPFCHNAPLVTEIDGAEYTQDEIMAYLKKRKGILEGVCITGGEPLLNKDIKELIYNIKNIGYPVKIDTNGSYPEVLENLIDEGLVDYVAMDIKSSPENYAKVAGVDNLDFSAIDRSVKLLLQNRVEYEFRTTVCDPLHTENDFISIAKWIKGAEKYFLQAFVDSGHLIGSGNKAFPKTEMERFVSLVAPFVKKVEIRGI